MPIEFWIAKYGYWALALGTLLEGEGVVLLAGFWAHLGTLSLPLVVLIAGLTATVGNSAAFLIGKLFRNLTLRRLQRYARQLEKLSPYVQHHQVMLILGFRFLYGLRSLIPYLLGMSGIDTVKFLAWNALGSFIWALLFAGLGFLAGNGLKSLVGNIRLLEQVSLGLFLLVVVFQLSWWVVRRIRSERGKKAQS